VLNYISQNRGETWQKVDGKWGYTNLKQWSEADRLMSRMDCRVLYDCYYKCKNGFGMSTDGGKAWTHINPVVQGGSAIYKIELIETGINSASRLYARIWMDENKGPRVGVSNDYGRHFELLPEGILEIVESRANPSIWYGKRKETRLIESNDSGKTWTIMEGSKEFWQPLYENYKRRTLQSWKQYPDDQDQEIRSNIMQIESDPTHPDWIYVLTYKGLYISRDRGKTFRLSSLAYGWIDSIDRIAVDPLDGRFIYAMVDLGKFYRSSDYGCSWELMKPPPFPQ
jgi:hypothetical protein